MWSFSAEHQKYLFFYDTSSDKSFSLKLTNASTCYRKPVWFTNERGYIVSRDSLTQYYSSVKKLDKQYFPLKSKSVVSESILKDCDLSAHSLDFEQIKSDYLGDPKNLKIIFKLHQKQIKDNNNYVLEFDKNLKKIHAFLESQGKDVNSNKIMLALYKTKFDSLNNSKNSQNVKGNGYHYNDKDLLEKISKMGDTITHLKNSIQMHSSSNQISKEHLEHAIANLKIELNKNYQTLNNNFSNSIQFEISNIKKLVSEIENTFLKKLEPKIVSANNYTKICNEKVENINNEIKKSLNALKQELSQNDILLEKNVKKYVDNIIVKKLDLSNSKLQNLEGKIKNNIFINENDFKTMVNKLEYLNKTSNSELDKLNQDLKILKTNYEAFDQKVEGSKELFKNEIILMKDLIATGNTNLKNEITDMYLGSGKDLSKDLIKVNGSLLSRIDFSDIKIQDIEQQLNNIKRDAENNRNSTNVKLNDIIKDVAQTSEKLNTIPTKIEEQILKKLNPTINSINSKSNNCKDKIENLKTDTSNRVEDLKRELTQLSNLGDEIMNTNLQKMKDSISNKIVLDNTKVRELENTLNKCRDFSENNKILTEQGLQEIKRNISGIFEFVNQASSSIDNNILNKYNSILSTLDDKSRDCMQEIANLKYNFDKSNKDLKQNIFDTFIPTDKEIITKLGNVNNSLLNKISSSDSKIQELETKIGEFKDNIQYFVNKYELNSLQSSLDETNKFIKSLPSKIEDELTKNINHSLSSLQKNNDNCDKEINDLKGDVKKSFDDIRKEVFTTFSSTGEDLQKINNSVLQIKDAYNKKIQYLENKTNSLSQAAKTKNPLFAKVEYLTKQADSTNKALVDNMDEINNVKFNLKKMAGEVNNLNSDNNSEKSYLSNLNQTVVRNTKLLRQLEDDINSLKNSGDIADIEIQKHEELIQQKTDDINKLQKNQQKTDKIIYDLKLIDTDTQQQLKEFQQEIKTLKNNISLSNKLIYDSDKTVIDLRNQIEELKIISLKKEQEFTETLSNFQNILNKFAGIDLKKELADLKKCCADKDLKIIENEKEIKKLKNESEKAIKELKAELEHYNDLNSLVEPESV